MLLINYLLVVCISAVEPGMNNTRATASHSTLFSQINFTSSRGRNTIWSLLFVPDYRENLTIKILLSGPKETPESQAVSEQTK